MSDNRVKNINLKVAMTCHHASGLAWDRNDERVYTVGGTLRYAENNDTYAVDIHDLEAVWSCKWQMPDAGEGYELCGKDEAEEYQTAGGGGFNGCWTAVINYGANDLIQYAFRRKIKAEEPTPEFIDVVPELNSGHCWVVVVPGDLSSWYVSATIASDKCLGYVWKDAAGSEIVNNKCVMYRTEQGFLYDAYKPGFTKETCKAVRFRNGGE